jgi:mevalonate kinase
LKASAPGKVLLLGEHAVVYGQPALAAALPRMVHVEVEEDPAGPAIELFVAASNATATPSSASTSSSASALTSVSGSSAG